MQGRDAQEKWTNPEKILYCNRVFKKRSDQIDEGTIIWLTPKQRDATLFDRRGIYTDKEEKLLPRVEVGKKSLDHRHEIPRDQSVLVRLQNNLQPEERFEVVNGKGETVLVSQDQDADKELDTEGVQLTYRYLKAIQHADDDFGNREPQAAAHYECFVTSKVTLQGITSTLSLTRNPEFHSIRNSVERPHGPKKVASAPTRCTFFDQTTVHNWERFLVGKFDRTISRNPPCLVLSWIYRMRHELNLRHKELFVDICGRGAFLRSLFLSRHFVSFKRKQEEEDRVQG